MSTGSAEDINEGGEGGGRGGGGRGAHSCSGVFAGKGHSYVQAQALKLEELHRRTGWRSLRKHNGNIMF